jgi:predicted nucleotidyltransferase
MLRCVSHASGIWEIGSFTIKGTKEKSRRSIRTCIVIIIIVGGKALYNYGMNTTTGRLDELILLLKEMLPVLRTQYRVSTLEVFGSFVRGEERENSDLDLLVTFDETPTLFKFLALENYLSDSLGVQVDLVMKESLKPIIGKYILEEAQNISHMVEALPNMYVRVECIRSDFHVCSDSVYEMNMTGDFNSYLAQTDVNL